MGDDVTDPMPPLPPKIRDEIVARHAAASRPWWREPLLWVVVGCVAVALAVIVVWVNSKLHDANKACVPGDRRGPCQVAAQANQKLESLGVPPVTTPEKVPVPTVTTTVTAAPSPPSRSAIEAAVASYCTQTQCGTGPTASQVAQAVATYCTVNGRCRGPSGPSGRNGSTGPSGQPGASGAAGASGGPGPAGAPGTDGQNATSDQVAAAVASYCADHDQCAGPTGPPGPTGENGGPGHDGTDGANGQPPVSWTYSDPLGIQHTCVRSDPFDPTAPTYTCH